MGAHNGRQPRTTRERERENYGNRDPLLDGGGQKADRPILPPAKCALSNERFANVKTVARDAGQDAVAVGRC